MLYLRQLRPWNVKRSIMRNTATDTRYLIVLDLEEIIGTHIK